MKDNIRYHVIVNIIRTVSITLLSFISFPFVCNKLGDVALGTYTWANTFVYYFLILAKLGIPNVAIRECAKVRNDKKILSQKAQEFFIMQGVLTILSFIFMCLIIFSIKGDLWSNKELIFLLSLNFLIGVFSFEWIYIALEKHFYISFRSIATLAFTSLLIIQFVRHPEHTYLYAFFSLLGTLITIVCNIVLLPKYIIFKRIQKYNFKQYIKPLLIVFAISFILTLYNQSDMFILGFLDPTKAEVGSYSVGIKGIEIIITIITSLSAVFMPRATMLYTKENKVFFNNLTNYALNICFFIAIPAIVTMAVLANEITNIISGNAKEGFENASAILIILVPMILTYSIGDMIYTQVLIPMRKEKYYLYTMIIGAILNIGGSIGLGLLSKDNPSIGVAIATIATDALILITLIIMTRKYVKKAIFNTNNLKIIIGGVILVLTTFLIKHYLSSLNSFIIIILSIVFGAIAYIGTLLILKEKLVSSFLKKRQ